MIDTEPITQTLVPLPISLRSTPLITNFYTANFFEGSSLHVYAVHFVPEVENDNRALRRTLLTSIEPRLSELIGQHVISGINIYGAKEHREGINVPCTDKVRTYTLSLQYTHPVSLTDGQRDTMMVLNILMKKNMRDIGLTQPTKFPKFYDQSRKVVLRDVGLEIWPGYTADLNRYEGIPLLNIDCITKIIHTRSFVENLQEYRSQGGDWVNQAKSHLEGRIVITNYGNFKCYKITEICMGKNPTDMFDRNGVQMSYIEYFRRQYRLEIADPRQPLIRSHIKQKMREFDIYLVPELVQLTGLDDEMKANHELMRGIPKPGPEERKEEENSLVARLKSEGIDMPPALQVPAYNIPRDQVCLHSNHTSNISPEGNFHVDSILEPIPLSNWVIMATERDQENREVFAIALQQKLIALQVDVKPPDMRRYDSRTFGKTLREMVEQGELQMVVILLAKSKKAEYDMIKKAACTTTVVPTQVVLMPINQKRFNSIIEKVALQIQAKVGAQLWTIQPSLAFGKFLMVIGIDVFHETVQRKKSVLGFCATIHPNLSKYFSTVAMHESGQEIATAIGTLFLEAIKVFKQKARRYPETVIFFRDGVAETQTGAVKEFEVQSVRRACQRVQEGENVYNPNLIYTVVVKKTGAKFFAPAGAGGTRGGRGGRGRGRGGAATSGGVSNPAPGTLVTTQVVPETGDFYLISHFANQGMSAPSLYRTVYTSNPNGFPLEELARLAYKLCHMYYNWSGAIKVPAPCMMAHKLAYFVGQLLITPLSNLLPIFL